MKTRSSMTLLLLFSLCYLQQGWSNNILLNEREEICFRIFNELKKARGLSINEKPQLIIVSALDPSYLSLAVANNSTGIIQIQKKTIHMCYNKLGDEAENGLAFILAHELAHYIRQHNVVHKFVSQFARTDSQSTQLLEVNPAVRVASDRWDSINVAYMGVLTRFRIRQNESEADLDAGFTSYLAGYQTKEAGQLFFDEAYPFFNLSDDSGMYPTLEERKNIVRKTGERLDTLIAVFEAANYLSIINEYDYARDCYEYVIREFRSKSILNNLGIIQLRKFIDEDDKKLVKYALPLTMELELLESNRDFTSEEERIATLTAEYKKKKAFLDQAIVYFDQAILLDNDYALPLLNKSIAYYLYSKLKFLYREFADFVDDDIHLAYAHALQARQIQARRAVTEEAHLQSNILGFLAVLMAEKKAPKADVEALFAESLSFDSVNSMVILNQKIYNNEAVLVTFEELDKGINSCTDAETIHGLDLTALGNSISERPEFTVLLNATGDRRGDFIKLRMKKGQNYQAFQVFTHSKLMTENDLTKNVNLFLPDGTSKETACLVELGGDLNDLGDFYGPHRDAVETTAGNLIHFHSFGRFGNGKHTQDGIVFKVEAAKVKGWVLYRKESIR